MASCSSTVNGVLTNGESACVCSGKPISPGISHATQMCSVADNAEDYQCSWKQFVAASAPSKRHILVGVSGSVAAVKLPELVQMLLNSKMNNEVTVISTESARHFYQDAALPGNIRVWRDQDEWHEWKVMGDPVLHIELRRWADIMIIAPLDANTLAKMATGACDNLLTCVARAWDLSRPLLFAPAMNTAMWKHPVTAFNIEKLTSWGYTQVPCVEKTLACGDTGLGAMASVRTIIQSINKELKHYDQAQSKSVLCQVEALVKYPDEPAEEPPDMPPLE